MRGTLINSINGHLKWPYQPWKGLIEEELQRIRRNKCSISICQNGTLISLFIFCSAQFKLVYSKVKQTKKNHPSIIQEVNEVAASRMRSQFSSFYNCCNICLCHFFSKEINKTFLYFKQNHQVHYFIHRYKNTVIYWKSDTFKLTELNRTFLSQEEKIGVRQKVRKNGEWATDLLLGGTRQRHHLLPLLLHERNQVAHSLLHDASRLDDLQTARGRLSPATSKREAQPQWR